MNTYLRDNLGRRSSAIFALWITVVAVGASVGQSPATVSVHVQLPGGAWRTGLRVRAVPKFTGAISSTWELDKKDFDFTDHTYTHTFYGLQPGQYSFVVCDGLDYAPGLQTIVVQSGTPLSVDFFLHAPETKREQYSTPPLHGPDGQVVGRDEPVFLKDSATGCTLKNGKTERGGIAKFPDVPAGKYHADNEQADRDP